jgi:hypothetical protein
MMNTYLQVRPKRLLGLSSVLLILVACSSNGAEDEATIRGIINDSFGWALTKDRARFEDIFTHEEDFFTYYPDSKSTVTGWTQFENFLDRWMDPRNVARGFEIRDLRLVLSRSGTVAWFSAIVDDNGEWDGEPWGAKDIRWTGVLEIREGKWVIVQQHMSEAKDKVIEQVESGGSA